MSQSPEIGSPSSAVQSYDVAWTALNKLIRAGRSFSGNERHCAYLNIGSGRRFANVSAVSGLDLPDDGRGLALTDWDHDGRLDLWITNRTGPRVRFFRNEIDTGNRFVALKLTGTSANRDAIGARVTLHLADGAPPLIRTLYAGSGYRSQSSKWLHFGLGSVDAPLERVSVRWPGGESESFSGVAPGGHFSLRQGTGRAEAWQPPGIDPKCFEGVPQVEAAPRDSSTRVVLLSPAPFPRALRYTDASGVERPLSEAFGAPLVLHLWTTWCPNCEEEMRAWSKEASRFESAGLGVLAICVDEPGEDREADLRTALRVAKERNYPFPVGLANAALVENLNILQRAFIGRQTDLPLPSSFLIDAQGNLAAIYKGHVTPDQLLADQAVCGADPERIMRAAIPFPGKWLRPIEPVVPRSVAIRLTEHGLLDEAAAYLRQLLASYESATPGESAEEAELRTAEAAECHHFLGAIHYDQGDPQAAEERYLKALSLNPSKPKTRRELTRIYRDRGDHAKAADQIEALLAERRNDPELLVQLAALRAVQAQPEAAVALYREALALQPADPSAHYQLANLLRDGGLCREAIPHYRQALELHPGWPLPANNLAWILATHPDSELRDGPEAVRLATIANESTGHQIPQLLGTLAAAHAEAGDFAQAATVSVKAIQAATAHDKPDLATRLEEKRALYQQRKAFRDETLARADEEQD